METARVIGRGHVRVQAGYEVEIPTGALDSFVDTGKALASASQNRRLSDAEKLQIFDAGVAFLTVPPSFSPYFGVTYGVTDDAEASLRWAGGGWRLAGRYQLLRREDGPFDMVVGLGLTRATTDLPLSDAIPALKVDEFARHSVDVPLLIGTGRDVFRVWGGPVLMYTHASTALFLDLQNDTPVAASYVADGVFLGAQGGIAVGWRHLFVAFELTVARFVGAARADIGSLAGGAGHEVSLRSTSFQPTLGLLGEI